jgi:hypothetical protein
MGRPVLLTRIYPTLPVRVFSTPCFVNERFEQDIYLVETLHCENEHIVDIVMNPVKLNPNRRDMVRSSLDILMRFG